MTHVLEVAGKEDAMLKCDMCNDDKIYPNQDALNQHRTAKHSNITTITATKSFVEHQTDSTMDEQCSICGAVMESMEEHMKAFEPIALSSYECDCGKVLGSERAFMQHRLFCENSEIRRGSIKSES